MSDFEHFSEIFDFAGTYLRQEQCSNGHINDTSRVVYIENGREVSYVHQRINHHVFLDIPGVMENIAHVTRYQRLKLEQCGHEDTDRRALRIIPTRTGEDYFQDGMGNFWRTFQYIESATAYEIAEKPAHLFEAARAFGVFQNQLSDLPYPLHETIPDFHNTPKRLAAFHDALEADPMNRARLAGDAIDYILESAGIAGRITDLIGNQTIPVRVTHNDTKLNNVLIDDRTGEGICVVDLDTVMPGTILYDFGDLVRAATCSVPEDASDLSGVGIDLQAYEEILRGYLSEASGFLNDTERDLLPFSAQLISLELGMRFLTDHLLGDTYFRIRRDDQNLHRARRQLAMARSIEENLDKMHAVLDSITT